MSIINKKLSKKGFTLIELMVAVIILVIAVLGIFLAFSNAWMGMANARDRTVATNYAREAMEDVKNMDFELVTTGNLGTAESVGAKFTRIIIVNTENENLKKINTTVSWINRQEQNVSVETSMYINRTIFNPGEASKLVLYADPYYTILPTLGSSNIIAVIKDIDGNTKIDWSGGDVHFTVLGTGYSDYPKSTVGSNLGYLGGTPGTDDVTVAATNGEADIIFHASAYMDGSDIAQGLVVIEASVDLPDGGGTISDTITIDVTLDVVRIALSADTYSIDDDGIDISTLTATLVNSGGTPVISAVNDITFNISSGDGIFVDCSDGSPLADTVTISPSSGSACIKVKSIADTPGVATVIASSTDLLSGTVDIIIVGEATSISVSVDHDLIYIGGPGAEVTVEIQDQNGNPVGYDGSISLVTSDGTGVFNENPVNPTTNNPSNPSSASTTFSSASPGIVTITASGVSLTEGSATIDVQAPLVANTISLSAIPKNILVGGFTDSEITATIKQGSTVISTYNKEITFKIILDTSTSKDAVLSFNGFEYGLNVLLPVSGFEYGEDGEAVVYLKSASDIGTCTIEVSTYNSDDLLIVNTIKVGFYAGEDHIRLSADPSKMLVNGDTCTVTAEVVDEEGTLITEYNEDITFTLLVGWPKNAKFLETGTSSLTTTLDGGDIDVYLLSQKEAGTVTLKASSFTGMTEITGYLNIPVVNTLLALALDPDISYIGNQVSFDIEVQGAEVDLVEMQVSWSPDDLETLNKIDIGGSEIIYSDIPVASGNIVVTVATLQTGISTINLYFNDLADMSGKILEVIFNPNSGNYHVEISEPPIE